MKVNDMDVALSDLTITLDLEDGTSVECDVLARFPLNGRQYIAISPVEEANMGDEIWLYRFSEDENGEPVLDIIENEDEFDAADERFDEILDEAEYDEWVTEDEDADERGAK